ncbi:glycosyltransferase family 32 protein [Halomonas citrativorans]|nr:glycosyltransferase [Halomonas citrativorans]
MIPKKIHYCWFGGREMSSLYKQCVETWRQAMPDFEIMEWNESSIDSTHPFIASCLKKKQWAFLSDYMRMVALRDHGGVYLDVDIEAVKSVAPLLKHDCFLGYEDEGRLNTAVLGGIAGHHFFHNAIDLIESRHRRNKPFLIAPEVANICVEKDASGIELLPWPCFYPYNPYAKVHDRKQLMYSYIEKNTYLIHHWGKGWKMSFAERLKRKLFK